MSGHYFRILPLVDTLGHWYAYRTNSLRCISTSQNCSWKLLYNYNYDKISSLLPTVNLEEHNLTSQLDKPTKDGEFLYKLKEPLEFFYTYQDKTPSSQFFFDAEKFLETLVFPDLWFKHHVIDSSKLPQHCSLNTAPAISAKAELELLIPKDLQVNMAQHKLKPVIFDTGASLAITGDK